MSNWHEDPDALWWHGCKAGLDIDPEFEFPGWQWLWAFAIAVLAVAFIWIYRDAYRKPEVIIIPQSYSAPRSFDPWTYEPRQLLISGACWSTLITPSSPPVPPRR